jgi:hypothetical protein
VLDRLPRPIRQLEAERIQDYRCVKSSRRNIGRHTFLLVDNARGRFELESRFDGHVVKATLSGDVVEKVLLDGRADFTQKEIERYQLAPAKVRERRNLFLYLLGLPMKLRDPGTRLEPVATRAVFQGTPVYELRVTYQESVGTDSWFFYLDPRTCALVGLRFYHGREERDGEFAVLSSEIVAQGLRLPRVRKWHKNQDDEWFITHTIESIEPP